MVSFPEEIQEIILARFGNTTLRIEVHDGIIDVEDVMYNGDSMDPLYLDEGDEDYWLGAVYWWYRMDGGDYWSTRDWRRAAQCCYILQHVPSIAYLRKVCGISSTGEPYDYYTMKRQMDLADFANKCNREYREGAD